jgi:hypothetical protein
MNRSMRRTSHLALFGALVLSTSGHAAAEASYSQKAAAEAAFQEAAKLFQDGRFAEACSTFEASQHLDPALGTMLRLADCYDRQGKTASAWAAFAEAAAAAAAQGRADREEIARERIAELGTRLSYLRLRISAVDKTIPGLELSMNGEAIPKATWGAPIPVNPGSQELRAQAPGYETWTAKVDVTATGELSFEVPHLVAQPISKAKPVTTVAEPNQKDAPALNDPVIPVRTVLAYVAGGVGIAALGAGGYLTYRAYDLNQQSLDHCIAGEENACTVRGRDLRTDALRNGNFATVGVAAGVGLVGLSAILFLTEPTPDAKRATTALRINAQVSTDGAEFALTGRW